MRFMGADIFGFPIALNYDSQPVFNTILGLCLSVAISIFTFVLFITKIISMVEMTDPNILILSKNMLDSDKAVYGAMNMTESNSIIAIGIQNFKERFIKIDEDIGTFSVFLKEYSGGLFRPNQKRIPLIDCRDIIPDTNQMPSNFREAYEAGYLFCIDKDTGILTDYDGDEINTFNIIFETCKNKVQLDENNI